MINEGDQLACSKPRQSQYSHLISLPSSLCCFHTQSPDSKLTASGSLCIDPRIQVMGLKVKSAEFQGTGLKV